MTKPAPVVLPQYQHIDMDSAGAALCSPCPTCNQNHDLDVRCCAVAGGGHVRVVCSCDRDHDRSNCVCSARVAAMVDDPPFLAVATISPQPNLSA